MKIPDDLRISLSCDIAHSMLMIDFGFNPLWDKEDNPIISNGEGGYNEKAQDIFNTYYDYVEGIIVSHLDSSMKETGNE